MIALPNVQPAEGLAKGDGTTLEIVGEPWLTIQGEGPLAGSPAVFVRLAGCNWDCPACDTDYTSDRRSLSCEELINLVVNCGGLSLREPLVVLTGGEPFRQPIGLFVNALLNLMYWVQIETNGTLPPPEHSFFHERLTVVCSPKAPRIHPALSRYIDAYKYILDAGNIAPEDGLPLTTMGLTTRVARPLPEYIEDGAEIFVQPLDTGDEVLNKRNEEAAIASCLRFGYRLSYQIHKHLGLK